MTERDAACWLCLTRPLPLLAATAPDTPSRVDEWVCRCGITRAWCFAHGRAADDCIAAGQRERDALVAALHQVTDTLYADLSYESTAADGVIRCDWCSEPWDGSHTADCAVGRVLRIVRDIRLDRSPAPEKG